MDIFKEKMATYRKDRRNEFIESHDGMTLNEYEEFIEEKTDNHSSL